MTTTAEVKGTGFNTAMVYAERGLGEEAVGNMLAALGKEHGVAVAEMRLPSSLVPLAFAERAWDGVAKLTALKSADELRTYFQDMGKFIAVSNLNGVYRSLLALLGSPSRLSRRLPTLWQMYFPGVTVDVDVSGLDGGTASHEVHGFGGAAYVAAMGEGWIAYAYGLVGGKDVVVNEEAMAAGRLKSGETLRFEARWRR
jgi:hypothetical protein